MLEPRAPGMGAFIYIQGVFHDQQNKVATIVQYKLEITSCRAEHNHPSAPCSKALSNLIEVIVVIKAAEAQDHHRRPSKCVGNMYMSR
jgi:hypothetical protein